MFLLQLRVNFTSRSLTFQSSTLIPLPSEKESWGSILEIMASKVLIWQVVGATVGLVSAIFLYRRHRKVKRRKFCIVEADETSGALETDSPLPASWTSLCLEQPLVIAMSGLPARGKSYVVKMIMRYLRWTGFECKLFNVGSYRRKMGLASADSNFFSAGNSDGTRMREELAMAVQESMYEWLHETSATDSSSAKRRVAIFDATNTTISRRLALAQKARKENVYLLFVESICDDAKVLAQNYAVRERDIIALTYFLWHSCPIILSRSDGGPHLSLFELTTAQVAER